MNANQSFLILLFLGALSARFTSLSEVCQRINPKFLIRGERSERDYNLSDKYAKGMFVGKGGFGEVRKAPFGFNGVDMIAIKNVKNDMSVLDEFDVLDKFSPMGVGPAFYGCQYDSTRIYIAQTLLYKDLSKMSTIYRFKKFKNSEFIARMRDVVDSLKTMWDNNYVHNDIKEHNIMTNSDFSKFYVIDFGLAQIKTEYMKAQGTPFYFSPDKWRSSSKKPTAADDLYSLAITIGILESVYGFDPLVTYQHPNGKMYELPQSCFDRYLTSHCQQVLKTNIRGVLTKANFGNYHRSAALKTSDKINFTTLVALMINYSDYPFDYETTVKILDRLITEFQTIESSTARTYKQKTKTSDFTDPDDEPDVYDFNRKYPRVHPSETTFFEKMHDEEVTRDLEADALKENIWKIDMEKEKLLEEQRLEAQREKEEEAARRVKAEKERQANLLKKKQEEEEIAKKAKQDHEEKVRQRNERIQAEKLAREKQEQERKERLKLEAQKKLADYNKGLDNKLRESKNRLKQIDKNQPTTHSNSRMFNEKPDLFNAVNDGKNIIKHREINIFAPKPMNINALKAELKGKNIHADLKNMKLNNLWPDNNKKATGLIPQPEKKVVNILADEGKGTTKVRFELNQKNLIWGATDEVTQEDMKTMKPQKPQINIAGAKPVVGQKRIYEPIGGRAFWQRYNQYGVWENTGEWYDNRIRLV